MNRVLIELKQKKSKIVTEQKDSKTYEFFIKDKGQEVSDEIEIGKEAFFTDEKLKAFPLMEIKGKQYAIVEDTDVIAIQ